MITLYQTQKTMQLANIHLLCYHYPQTRLYNFKTADRGPLQTAQLSQKAGDWASVAAQINRIGAAR